MKILWELINNEHQPIIPVKSCLNFLKDWILPILVFVLKACCFKPVCIKTGKQYKFHNFTIQSICWLIVFPCFMYQPHSCWPFPDPKMISEALSTMPPLWCNISQTAAKLLLTFGAEKTQTSAVLVSMRLETVRQECNKLFVIREYLQNRISVNTLSLSLCWYLREGGY